MSTVITDKQALANIAANVRRLRGGNSMKWLADRVGVFPAAIQRIERAENMPGAGLLARLADALETTTDALLSLDAESFQKSA